MKMKENFVTGVAAGVTLLALATVGFAQPDIVKRQDRHPAYADEPPAVRVVPLLHGHEAERGAETDMERCEVGRWIRLRARH